MNPIILTDFYKVNHQRMYPERMTLLYSNLTPRKSRLPGVDSIVFFGLQHFVKTYLIEAFNKEFFSVPVEEVIAQYEDEIKIDTSHIRALHNLGYLPIKIKALPEGSLCPIGVPCLTIVNTHPDFAWLTNYLETLMSCMLWQPITSATIALEYVKLLSKHLIATTGTDEGFNWQIHDFSMRGMSSVESAIISGMAHLAVGLTGSDNIPAIYQAKKSYGATGLIGGSIPATEHSVMCMGEKESELETFKRLLDLYPEGLLSVVSDTWDLWKVLTEYLPALKDQILARDGKLVIRPDSGDPVDIICGTVTPDMEFYKNKDWMNRQPAYKGVIELLWDVFGGTVNDQGFKVLDPNIGAIYGDSITLERAEQILTRLEAKGFAASNIVFGVGSFTYQYNTRDTFGFAVKATYGEVNGVGREIFKDPITDDGTKKSKKGLLFVQHSGININSKLEVHDQATWEQERGGLLETVFEDGELVRETTLEGVRNRVAQNY